MKIMELQMNSITAKQIIVEITNNFFDSRTKWWEPNKLKVISEPKNSKWVHLWTWKSTGYFLILSFLQQRTYLSDPSSAYPDNHVCW
jgi:hypothetical protein